MFCFKCSKKMVLLPSASSGSTVYGCRDCDLAMLRPRTESRADYLSRLLEMGVIDQSQYDHLVGTLSTELPEMVMSATGVPRPTFPIVVDDCTPKSTKLAQSSAMTRPLSHIDGFPDSESDDEEPRRRGLVQ